MYKRELTAHMVFVVSKSSIQMTCYLAVYSYQTLCRIHGSFMLSTTVLRKNSISSLDA